MDFTVIIPARYQSQRLPGKALIDIAGKPMIQWVYERAQASQAKRIIIATDDQRIVDVVDKFNGESCLTSNKHVSGTTRIAEVIDKLKLQDDDIIVNVQGDEPTIPPEIIDQVAHNLSEYKEAKMATLCEAITDTAEIFNPNIVKVVFDQIGYALYFSRAAIPWDRQGFSQLKKQTKGKHYRHIGIYAYRADFIKQYIQWPACELEQLESLEQLRALWQGVKIHVAKANAVTYPGVDTPEDLKNIIDILSK